MCNFAQILRYNKKYYTNIQLMSKKIFAFFMAALTAICFVSCKDDKTNETDPNTPSDVTEADYTVIFIGEMGGNDIDVHLDFDKFLQYRENEKIGSNVNVTGIVKSTMFQNELKAYGYDGAVEFTLGHKTGRTINIDTTVDANTLKDCSHYVTFCKETNAKRVGGADYDITSPEAIRSVIQKAAKEYPAKNYVLLLLGHGEGFNPVKDIPNAAGYATRACVTDQGNGSYITCDNLVAAINTSGVKIQTIFFQNCLMSTLENLSAYQHCADYAFISSEVTDSYYMQEFIAGLSNVGGDTDKLKAMANGVVDYYIDVVRPDAKSLDPLFATSHGFYDLSKMPDVLKVVKSAASWYADAAEKDTLFMSSVIEDVNCAADFDGKVAEYFGSFIKCALDDYATMDVSQIPDPKQAYEALTQGFARLIMFYAAAPLESKYAVNFPFAHLMKVTLDSKANTSAGLDFTALQSLYNQYLTAIKSMAYIRANFMDKSVADYEYIFTSPSVCLFSFDPANYHPAAAMNLRNPDLAIMAADEFAKCMLNEDHVGAVAIMRDLFCGNPYAYTTPYDEAKASYCGSQFDKATGWFNFLAKLKSNPSAAVNPTRIQDRTQEYYKAHKEEIMDNIERLAGADEDAQQE